MKQILITDTDKNISNQRRIQNLVEHLRCSKPLTIFVKSSIIDVQLGSEYAFANDIYTEFLDYWIWYVIEAWHRSFDRKSEAAQEQHNPETEFFLMFIAGYQIDFPKLCRKTKVKLLLNWHLQVPDFKQLRTTKIWTFSKSVNVKHALDQVIRISSEWWFDLGASFTSAFIFSLKNNHIHNSAKSLKWYAMNAWTDINQT